MIKKGEQCEEDGECRDLGERAVRMHVYMAYIAKELNRSLKRLLILSQAVVVHNLALERQR